MSRSCFANSRRLIAVDGSFTTGKFVMTLLIAVGTEANGKNTILARGLVESENTEPWKYFLYHLGPYLI